MTEEFAARFTRIADEPIFFPFSPETAFPASSRLGISTKPKPLERPVLSSITKLQDFTFPYFLNRSRTSVSVSLRSRLRMRICKTVYWLDKRCVFSRKMRALILRKTTLTCLKFSISECPRPDSSEITAPFSGYFSLPGPPAPFLGAG